MAETVATISTQNVTRVPPARPSPWARALWPRWAGCSLHPPEAAAGDWHTSLSHSVPPPTATCDHEGLEMVLVAFVFKSFVQDPRTCSWPVFLGPPPSELEGY